jgi:hypothetical protein
MTVDDPLVLPREFRDYFDEPHVTYFSAPGVPADGVKFIEWQTQSIGDLPREKGLAASCRTHNGYPTWRVRVVRRVHMQREALQKGRKARVRSHAARTGHICGTNYREALTWGGWRTCRDIDRQSNQNSPRPISLIVLPGHNKPEQNSSNYSQ